MNVQPVTILIVDDDKVDVMAVKRSFRDLKIANPVVEAHNGQEALDLLRGENGREKVPSPCLVMLDLNMPLMGGIEFLAELRRDPDLHRTVVFVMTTSTADEDRIKAYNHNVSGYVLKYRPGQTFLEAIGMLEAYWRVVVFPD
jgi:CheY-like chemotaxis protein